MLLGFDAFRLRSERMRKLMDYIGTHLDDELRLDDLADIIGLSATHLVRTYQYRVGEPPMQTLRRLRLERALRQIREQRYRTLTDVGADAGYGSCAAFTHAFTRQFGIRPSDIPRLGEAPPPPCPLWLESMPALQVWQMPYAGAYQDNGYFKARLAWRYYRAGGVGWRGWRLNDRDRPFCEENTQRVELSHFLPAAGNTFVVPEAEKIKLPGGLYAVALMAPDMREANMQHLPGRILEKLGCLRAEGRLIERDLFIRDFRVPQERRIALYIPVVRTARAGIAHAFTPLPGKMQIPIKTPRNETAIVRLAAMSAV